MAFGLEIEIRNVKLKSNIRVERFGRKTKLSVSPFPFKEILLEEGNVLKGRLLARFSNLDGVTPTLNSILRAIKSIGEFERLTMKVGSFYELEIDSRRGIVTATGLADMRKKNFKLQDVERLELGKIWRKIYAF